MEKKLIFLVQRSLPLMIVLMLTIFMLPMSHATDYQKAVIFYNEACGDCPVYVNELAEVLEGYGIEVETKDYINDRESRKEMNEITDMLGVPIKLQGHITAFIDNRIILEGHVPIHVVKDLLEKEPVYDKIIVLQDEMHGNIENYKVWAFKGDIKEYSVDTPISEYLDWFEENKGSLITPPELKAGLLDFNYLLPLVLVTGLLDGINPCAFGVLLFFIALLFTLKRSRSEMFKVGAIYIFMIYITYFLIGIGILQAILISSVPHLIARIAAVAIIIVGIFNIKDYFWYGRWFSFSMPKSQTGRIKKYMEKATLPSTVILGFLVGLCTFPCSGGIYVGILGLLVVTTTYFQGLAYLVIYNIMFVIPLIIILLLATNKRMVKKMEGWKASEKRYMKLIAGIVMILLGLFILFGGIL